jgi:hypothetical protein
MIQKPTASLGHTPDMFNQAQIMNTLQLFGRSGLGGNGRYPRQHPHLL